MANVYKKALKNTEMKNKNVKEIISGHIDKHTSNWIEF